MKVKSLALFSLVVITTAQQTVAPISTEKNISQPNIPDEKTTTQPIVDEKLTIQPTIEDEPEVLEIISLDQAQSSDQIIIEDQQQDEPDITEEIVDYDPPDDINTEDQDPESCDSNDDCSQAPFYICGTDSICVHKSIFPIFPIEFFGLLVLPILIGFANVGGIGGGGLTIPLLMSFWGFNTKESIAISGFQAFVGAVVRYFYSFNSRHPEKDSTHIDYGIVIVMLPLVILGSFIGVIVNIIMPPIVLSIMLTLLLVVLTIQAAFSAVSLYRKESAVIAQGCQPESTIHRMMQSQPAGKLRYLPDIRYDQKVASGKIINSENSFIEMGSVNEQPNLANSPLNSPVKRPLSPNISTLRSTYQTYLEIQKNRTVRAQSQLFQYPISKRELQKPEERSHTAVSDDDIRSLDQLLQAEASHLKQWSKHLLAFVAITMSLLVNFIRGSKKKDSLLQIKRCSQVDWFIFGCFIVFMIFLSALGLKINQKEQALKQRVGRGLVPSDIRYNGKQLVYLLFFAFWGGFISGALGLGGGSVFNPVMISLGVPPLVSTSTGMYMIMFSTAASTVMYISYGTFNVAFAIWISFWCSMGIMVGVSIMDHLIKKYKRQSILVIVLTVILGFSAVLVPYDNVSRILSQPVTDKQDLWRLNNVCE